MAQMVEVRIRENQFQTLQEYSALSGITVEKAVDEAISALIEETEKKQA